jgi:hypothetical protein
MRWPFAGIVLLACAAPASAASVTWLSAQREILARTANVEESAASSALVAFDEAVDVDELYETEAFEAWLSASAEQTSAMLADGLAFATLVSGSLGDGGPAPSPWASSSLSASFALDAPAAFELTGAYEGLQEEYSDLSYRVRLLGAGGPVVDLLVETPHEYESYLNGSIEESGLLPAGEYSLEIEVDASINSIAWARIEDLRLELRPPRTFVVAENPSLGPCQHCDSYLLPLVEPADVEHALELIASGGTAPAPIAVAEIAAGADGVNRDVLAPEEPPWSWHVTRFDGFYDNTVEILDGWPSFVESDVAGWIENTRSEPGGPGVVGFWGYTVVAEVPEPGSAGAWTAAGALLGCAWRGRRRFHGRD